MQRVCFELKVRLDRLEEYRQRHRAVWPEMAEALRAAGWHNYSLFLKPDGILIGYLECEDFARAKAEMALTEVNARWQASVAELFEELEGSDPDQAMQPIEEVFHLP
ncbi:MAG: L-rhamnose mutarotase [Actinomycetota bacterium]|nr:L-rhamnose mutarotase [Actinomycetota bacterium]